MWSEAGNRGGLGGQSRQQVMVETKVCVRVASAQNNGAGTEVAS